VLAVSGGKGIATSDGQGVIDCNQPQTGDRGGCLEHSRHQTRTYPPTSREACCRKFWGETRECKNPAFLQRYINFSRIYARFRDMDYLPHTMLEWDAAIARLFDHDRGKQPANDLVRK